MRIAVATPESVVRAGIACLMAAEPEIGVVATADSGHELRVAMGSTPVDVVVIDLDMGDVVVELLREKSEAAFPAVVGFLNGEAPPVRTLSNLIKAGLDGIVRVNRVDDVARAIRETHRGSVWVSPALGAHVLRGVDLSWSRSDGGSIAGDPDQAVVVSGPRLTATERSVLHLVADGYTDRTIAEQTRRTGRTIKYHVSNLLTKFQARNRAHLVNLAIRTGDLPANVAIAPEEPDRTTRDSQVVDRVCSCRSSSFGDTGKERETHAGAVK
ncbi:response regulator transcription factor [Haloechinothrix halophila]|nr:response regulator transcription factor [Haloechinothrix halophila]